MSTDLSMVTSRELSEELARREAVQAIRQHKIYQGEREVTDACDLEEINPHMAEAMNR